MGRHGGHKSTTRHGYEDCTTSLVKLPKSKFQGVGRRAATSNAPEVSKGVDTDGIYNMREYNIGEACNAVES